MNHSRLTESRGFVLPTYKLAHVTPRPTECDTRRPMWHNEYWTD